LLGVGWLEVGRRWPDGAARRKVQYNRS
jgi:hypothetical protein